MFRINVARLHELVAASGLSNSKIITRSFISDMTFRRLMNGYVYKQKSSSALKAIEKLATFFKVPVEELIIRDSKE